MAVGDPACTGNGTTITMVQTNWVGRIKAIRGHEKELPVLEDDDLSTVAVMRYCAGSLATMTPFEIDVYWNSDTEPTLGPAGDVTLSFPFNEGHTGAKPMYIFSGFVNKVTFPELSNNERIMGTMEIQPDGITTLPNHVAGIEP